MKHLTMQDIHDLLKGCVILGTGGGGELSEGLALINEAAALNKEFRLVNTEEVPDDAMIITPYFLGAISELPPEELEKYKGLAVDPRQPILTAANKLEEYLNRPVYGTIACEMGGMNTAVPMYVAALKGAVVLDADCAARAVPEVQNSTYYIHNLPVAPIFLANEFGEVAIFENIKDDARAETILRSFAVVSKHSIAAIDHALPMGELKHAIIPGTVTKALELGRAFRGAKEKNRDLAQAIADAGGGKVVFAGSVEAFDWKTESGFTLGSVQAKGTGKCRGDLLKIWFQNENLMSWLNGEIFVTLPDLICIIDLDKGEPVTNPNYEKGMKIAVILYSAPDAFTTKKGIDAFGPRCFGFDIDYTPAMDRIDAV